MGIISKMFNKKVFKKVDNIDEYKSISQDNKKSYIYGLDSPMWSENNYDNFSQEGYKRNVIAFRCINMIINSITSIPIKLKNKSNGITVNIEEHRLLKLLNKPNNFTYKNDFFSNIILHKMISGNAYILMIEDNLSLPVELHLLRPDKVSILIDKNKNTVSGYRYKTDNNNYKDYKYNKITGKSPILHIKNLNPSDNFYGLSNIEVAFNNIDQYNHTTSWIQSLLQNGARPSGALIVKGNGGGDDSNKNTLSIEQYNRLKDQIHKFYSGSANAGRPILLEGGLEWKELSLSPKDMNILDLKHSASRDIALSFGIPPQLLGIPGDNRYSNLIEARLALWEQTILPLFDDILESLNNWLTIKFGKDLELYYDREEIDIIFSNRGSQWEKVKDINFITVNEKRKMFNFNPIEGGDKL